MKYLIFLITQMMIFAIANSMPGGWKQVQDLNSPEIRKNSQKAAEMLSESMNSLFYMKLMNVTKAETQVVSGMNYRFEFSLGKTQCKKSENISKQEIEDCPLQKCEKPLNCSVTMWDQPWRNMSKITKSSCEEGESIC